VNTLFDNASARRRIAFVAFWLHHPGTRLIYGLKQRRWLRRLNTAVLVASIAAAIAIWFFTRETCFAVTAFVAGHLVWSFVYAGLILGRPEGLFRKA
jgi:hypothetical protein